MGPRQPWAGFLQTGASVRLGGWWKQPSSGRWGTEAHRAVASAGLGSLLQAHRACLKQEASSTTARRLSTQQALTVAARGAQMAPSVFGRGCGVLHPHP